MAAGTSLNQKTTTKIEIKLRFTIKVRRLILFIYILIVTYCNMPCIQLLLEQEVRIEVAAVSGVKK